jgi:DNA-binding LacI/PurR family transcriptional regulator
MTPPRRPTSHDVARAAGVAQSTVSRSFKQDSRVSQQTRDQVVKVATSLGYIPNTVARSLITKRSNMVGVIVTEYTLKHNTDLVYTLGEALRAAGIGLLLLVVKDDTHVGDILPAAMEYPLDGLISCSLIDPAQIDLLLKRGVALVFFNRNVAHVGVDSLLTNHAAGAAEVARRLLAAGHKRLLCMAGPKDAPVSKMRSGGFFAALGEAGVQGVPAVYSAYSYEAARAAFLDHVRDHAIPEAVFCVNDHIAMGVQDACRFDLGLKVPEDISIVGFDDVREAARPTYALTTLRQQLEPMAKQAVELLIRRMAQPDALSSTVLVQAQLIERGSARL